jgi:hypothetical protein
VAVLFADGNVVVVVADAPPGVVVVEEEELLDVPPGEEPAPAEFAEDPFTAVALEAVPRVSGADLVWNASTPASPATVDTATIVTRFIGFGSLFQVSWNRLTSQCESLVVDAVTWNAEATSCTHDAIAESSRSADIDVSVREVWDEMPERPSIKAHLVARTDHLVKSATALFDEREDLVAVHEVIGR